MTLLAYPVVRLRLFKDEIGRPIIKTIVMEIQIQFDHEHQLLLLSLLYESVHVPNHDNHSITLCVYIVLLHNIIIIIILIYIHP